MPCKYLHFTSTTFKSALSRQYICLANICIIRLLHSSQPYPANINICIIRLLHSSQPYPANIFALQISALYVYYIQVSLIPPIYLPCKYLHYTSTTFKSALSRQYICPANICIIRLLHSSQPYPANIFALQISALYVYYIQVSLSRQYICLANICIIRLLHSSQPYPANIFALQISALYVYYIQVSLIPPIYLPCKYLHYTSTTFKLIIPPIYLPCKYLHYTSTTFKSALSRQYICPANICIIRLLHSS